MSDLDRILKLAGFEDTQGHVEEAEQLNASDYTCKDCGDTMHSPTTDCSHDCDDETGDWWRDKDGNGVPDSMEERSMKEDDMEEAVGDSASGFYRMQDEFAGGEADGAHKVLIDELVRYLSGDQLEDFVSDFERHHDMVGDMEEAEIDEADIEENAFNQAAAAAARAGKDSFEFGGKTHKTTMKKDTAHKLDDDIQMEACGDCGCDPKNPKPGCDCPSHNHNEDISEAPTMDTTQLITLLKNAGLSETAIQEKLNEWANTPDNIGEVEPREHGDAYDFAQGVNLSLKRYLDAENMKVNVQEHTVTDMKALYEAKKNS